MIDEKKDYGPTILFILSTLMAIACAVIILYNNMHSYPAEFCGYIQTKSGMYYSSCNLDNETGKFVKEGKYYTTSNNDTTTIILISEIESITIKD